jgi:hypothetical protein
MKSKNNYPAYLALMAMSVFIGGCFSMPRSYGPIWHSNIEPIYPTMNYSFGDRYKTIDTLTPELKWTDIKKPDQTYDLCIWKADSGTAINYYGGYQWTTNASWGTPVYYTNHIAENFHQINHPLEPNTYYNWAVRIREGEKVRAWSSFNQVEDRLPASIGTQSELRYNNPFGFKTGDIKP